MEGGARVLVGGTCQHTDNLHQPPLFCCPGCGLGLMSRGRAWARALVPGSIQGPVLPLDRGALLTPGAPPASNLTGLSWGSRQGAEGLGGPSSSR